ncbi:hypothetical protein VTP01DRAFT_10158 [Rhizomucor pusillus]|uniref:uncharacterized protein n=1 Tax=Rhizomucor pusillus TaxID=4840 RepID=UPI003742ED98
MFSQKQQAAFKFVIKSKIQDNTSATEQPTPSSAAKAAHSPTTSTATSPTSVAAATSTDPSSPAAAAAAPPSNTVENERKRKRPEKDTVPLASKKIHSQLEKWNKKKAELSTSSSSSADPAAEEEADVFTIAGEHESFADLSIRACLLCQRKFKTLQDLSRHEEASELHKKNLADPACVGKARMKMRYIKTNAEKAEEQAAEQQYRNRAAERRQAYGQPERPVLPSNSAHSHKEKKATERPASAAAAAASVEKPLADDNIGARMLQQMGWRKGEGLGRDKGGIVNPIAAEQYAKGAGLGTAYAKRPITSSSGHESYKEKVKEMARRRFEEES